MSENQSIRKVLDALTVPYQADVPLSAYTGFRTGGPADFVVSAENPRQFAAVVRALRAEGLPFYILGKGSNVLAADEGYRGAVLLTEPALTALAIEGDEVICGAGVPLARLCIETSKLGLSGLEFAYGIPGTVGGAVFMNAGAYGGEIKDVCAGAELLCASGVIVYEEAAKLDFSYRHSAVQESGAAVLTARFQLTPAEPGKVLEAMENHMRARREKQPLNLPSCGSAFKRPVGAYASKLIDDCGLRGFAVGGAQVSEKHCGFIVNRGGATSAEILALADEVVRIVKEKTGFVLEKEIRILK